MNEVRLHAKRLSSRSPVKISENDIASAQASEDGGSYLKGYFTESNQNARAPATAKVSIDGLDRTAHSKKNQNRGKVQKARVRAKIAALASKKALNRSKAASKVKQEDESDFVVATTRVSGSDLPCHRAETTPLSGQQSCLSTFKPS